MMPQVAVLFKTYIKRFLFGISKIIQIQILMIAVSTPILVYWGLPISMMSPIGNIVFTPFLTIFLSISSLIFFSEILCIPNGFLILCFDKFNNLWMTTFDLGSKKWLIGLQESIIISALPFICFTILKTKNLNKNSKIILNIIFILVIGLSNKLLSISNENFDLPIFNKKLQVITKNNEITIIDSNNVFSRSRNIKNVLEFNIKPFLNKKLGHCKIKNLFISRLNKNSIKIAKNSMEIENIYLSYQDRSKLIKI